MHHLSTAWKHIRRSPYQSLAAILTMTLTFYVAALFFITAVGLQSILTLFEKQPQITAFFSDSKSEEEIKDLDDRLRATGMVEKTVYVSKEEALRIYQEQNKNDPLLLEMVTADILPASLEVSALNPSDLKQLADVIEKEPGVEDVVYQKDVIETLISWIKGVRTIGIGLVSLLLIVSLLVLLTVISMKIALKREEIEILRLLGATGWYIRWPFLLEGGLYGLIAAFLSWAGATASTLWVMPFIQSLLAGIPSLSFSPIMMSFLLGGMLLSGFVLGILGSMLALIRYL